MTQIAKVIKRHNNPIMWIVSGIFASELYSAIMAENCMGLKWFMQILENIK